MPSTTWAIAPTALLSDGLMDVTGIPVLPTLYLMAARINFALGRNHHDDRLRTYRTRHAHLRAVPDMPFSVDGEPTRAIERTKCRMTRQFVSRDRSPEFRS